MPIVFSAFDIALLCYTSPKLNKTMVIMQTLQPMERKMMRVQVRLLKNAMLASAMLMASTTVGRGALD
jgi:hypothetical protein